MAPPEHILLGLSIANIYQSIQTLFKKKFFPNGFIVVTTVLFALLPDIDSFFGYYTSRNVYLGHRGITHSLFFILLSSLIFTFFIFLYKHSTHNKNYTNQNISYVFLFGLAFASGLSHIIADLPQPSSIWRGIPFFFPLKNNGEYVRIGGWGKIGWYDLRIIWHLIYAALFSGGILVLISVLKRRGSLFAVRIAAITVILINLVAYVNIAFYISRSTHISNESWNKKQNQYLEDSPLLVRSITITGKAVVLKIFYTIRH